MSRAGYLTLFVPFLAVWLAFVACGTAPAERSADGDPPPRTAPAAADGPTGVTTPAREVFFPTLNPNSTGLPDALGIGTLIVDGRGCLRLRNVEHSATPLWPPSFELRAGKKALWVVDGRGRLRAKVGEKVRLGGGYTSGETIKGSGVLKARTQQELLERCPGRYFLTQDEGMRMPA